MGEKNGRKGKPSARCRGLQSGGRGSKPGAEPDVEGSEGTLGEEGATRAAPAGAVIDTNVADIVKAVDHKHIVSPTASKELKITSRGMQTQFIVQCPHCDTTDITKYGSYRDKLITYYRCNRCTVVDQANTNVQKRRRPFTFPVQQVWR